MKIKTKHGLNFSVGIFWMITGGLTIQLSLFVIAIPMESKELWFEVLDTINKSPMNLMVAFALFAIGFFQAIFGIFMSFTRDSSIDKHFSKKSIEEKAKDSEHAPKTTKDSLEV